MKHSTYILMPPWADPSTFKWERPYAWDSHGNVTHAEHKPAFIKAYPACPPIKGWVVCARIMAMDVKKPMPPQ